MKRRAMRIMMTRIRQPEQCARAASAGKCLPTGPARCHVTVTRRTRIKYEIDYSEISHHDRRSSFGPAPLA